MLGLLHKAMGDAVEEGLIEKNPVIRATSRKVQRSRRAQRLTANPLRPEEVSRFLGTVPEWYRDFYTIWFYTGWRSSEIVAIRFGWLDFRRQTVALKRGRMPRFGGLEAEPKTGPREVDCSYAPEIFAALARLRERAKSIGPEDFVFTNPAGQPLSQERLHDRIWTRRWRVPESRIVGSIASATLSSLWRSRREKTPAGWRRSAEPRKR